MPRTSVRRPIARKSMGIVGAAIGIGFMLGPAIGGLLAGNDLNSANFIRPALAAAALSLVAITLVVCLLPESHRPGARGAGEAARGAGALRLLSARPALRAIAAASFLVTCSQSMFESIFAIWALQQVRLWPAHRGPGALWSRAPCGRYAGRARADSGAAFGGNASRDWRGRAVRVRALPHRRIRRTGCGACGSCALRGGRGRVHPVCLGDCFTPGRGGRAWSGHGHLSGGRKPRARRNTSRIRDAVRGARSERAIHSRRVFDGPRGLARPARCTPTGAGLKAEALGAVKRARARSRSRRSISA